QRGRFRFVGQLERMFLLGVGTRIQTLRFFGALPVNDQVASDGEEPSLEFRFAVVLMAALEHADPRFLKEVLGATLASGDVDGIPQPRVFSQKSSDLLEKKRLEFFADAKEFARARKEKR